MSRLARLLGPSVLVVVGVAVLAVPARSSTADAQRRVDAAERLVDDLSWDLEDLTLAAGSAADLQSANEELLAAVPDEHDLAAVIIELQALAEASGLALLDVVPTSVFGSFDDARTPPGSSSVVLAVALRGEFAEFLDLLEALGSHERLVVVDAVSVGVDDVTGELAVDLELRVFTTEELVEYTDEFLDDEFLDDEFAEDVE